jgi:hypothetical protein
VAGREGGRRTAPPFRRAAGSAIPPEAVRLAKQQRAIFNDIKNSKRERKEAGAIEALRVQRRVLCKRRDAIIKAHLELHLRSVVDRLVDLLRRNPHRFYKEFKKLYPIDPEVVDEGTDIPPAPSKKEMALKMLESFKAQATESRVIPPGVSLEAWMQFVPLTTVAGSAGALLHAITWQEVYRVVYPAHEGAGAKLCDGDNCLLCAAYVGQMGAWEHDSPFQADVEHRPRLWTSKAAGPDGWLAETLRWSGPKDEGARFAWRQGVCMSLATIFTRILERGEVPDSPQFRDATLYPVHKSGDKTDPNNYRGICVSGVLGKVFGLTLCCRVNHWAHVNRIVSREQTGFMAHHGCDYSIFTVTEALRHRMRNKLGSYACFIDYKRAYDNCHLAMGWRIMERMGMPMHFIGLLRQWNEGMRISVSVNGSLSEPFNQTRGYAQGGVLSPILFALTIEPLIRCIKAMAGEHGIDVNSNGVAAGSVNCRLTILVYADDVIVLANSRASLETVVRRIHEWSEAHGFVLGLGKGKTMAMHFPPGHCAGAKEDDADSRQIPPHYAEVLDPIHVSDDIDIEWTFCYKFLGYRLRMDLRGSSALRAINTNTHNAVKRLFPNSRVVRRMAMATQIQLLKTIAVGCASSLLPFIDIFRGRSIDDKAFHSLDVTIRKGLASILDINPDHSKMYVHAATGVPCLYSTAVAARHRFLWALEQHPLQSLGVGMRPLACDMLDVLKAEAATPSRGIGQFSWAYLSNWYTITCKSLTFDDASRPERTITVAIPALPSQWWEVGPCAALLLREVEWKRWNAELRGPPPAMADGDSGLDEQWAPTMIASEVLPQYMSERPPMSGPKTHLQHIFNVSRAVATTTTISAVPRQSAMSLQAPACNGSILTHATSPPAKAHLVIKSRLGPFTMALAPFGLSNSALGLHTADGARGDVTITANVNATNWCSLCTGCKPAVRSGLFHYAIECTSEGLRPFQKRLRQACLDLILWLVRFFSDRLIQEQDRAQRFEGSHAASGGDKRYRQHRDAMTANMKTLHTELTTAVSEMREQPTAWDDGFMRAMLYQLLVGVPYSRHSTTFCPPGVIPPRVVLLTGLMFDTIALPNRELSPACTRWVNWSAKRLAQLAHLLAVLRPRAEKARQAALALTT